MNIELFKALLTQDLPLQEQVDLLRQCSLDQVGPHDLVSCAQSMLEQAHKIPLLDDHAVDLVGTGGDGFNTFNISTTAAIVAAAAGVKMAKHGNRSVTSRSGSFDLLQALGVSVPESPEQAKKQFLACGITFLFGPYFHPALKRVMPARQVLSKQGISTIFNVMGPLVNPMQVKRQAVGVFRPDLIKPYIESLQARGMEKSLVFHGQGLDELSLTGVNQVAMLNQGVVTVSELDPSSLGLMPCALQDLQGGTPAENADMTIAILTGEDHSAKRDIVLLNAAAAIIVSSDDALGFLDAIAMAREALDSGQAMRLLETLRSFDVNTH